MWCLLFAQVRDDMRTAGVMPSEEMISKPDSGERSPCSFDISQAEWEMELWCWAKCHHHQREATIPDHTEDNCSNYRRSTENILRANKTELELYHSDSQHWILEFNSCGFYKTLEEIGKELRNYPTGQPNLCWMNSGDLGETLIICILCKRFSLNWWIKWEDEYVQKNSKLPNWQTRLYQPEESPVIWGEINILHIV
jgi:hypothetical protein